MMLGARNTVVVLMLMTTLALFGCGESETTSTGGGSAETGSSTTQPQAAQETIPAPMQAFVDGEDVAEIVIYGNDRMQYDVDRFNVRAGQMVRLTLRHTGNLPVQSMGHNVVILKQGDEVFEFAADVAEQGGAKANNYVPEPVRDRVIAFTAVIGGGESATVEFQAPQETGDYPFLCSFPGHAGMMNGHMEVQE